MFDILKSNSNNRFFEVKNDSISQAEKNMGVIIPDSLKALYSECGYGFLETQGFNVNRLMGPRSIEEFRLSTGQYEGSDIAEELKEYSKDKLVFMEIHESLYVSIGITKMNYGKVYYYDEVIADDLEAFLNKYTADENFFLDE